MCSNWADCPPGLTDSQGTCLVITYLHYEDLGQYWGKRIYFPTNDRAVYINDCTVSKWYGWEPIAAAVPPQEYELPLVDGFSIPEVGIKNRYYKDQFGRVMVDFAVSGTFNANEHVHIATLPAGFIPSFVAHATAYNYTGEPPIVAVWVDGSGKIFCHASETISGVAGQIEFIAHK